MTVRAVGPAIIGAAIRMAGIAMRISTESDQQSLMFD
jgi:hypothetical protein